jgi:hypothetical protein
MLSESTKKSLFLTNACPSTVSYKSEDYLLTFPFVLQKYFHAKNSVIITIFLAVLGVEFRALYMPGRRYTTWAMPPALFALVIFELESSFMPRLTWTVTLLFVLPCASGLTGVHYGTQSLLEMRSCEFFTQADFEPQSSGSLPPK